MPTQKVNASSPHERLTSVSNPLPENIAPRFLAVLRTTCWSPRSTSTSVSASGNILRREMASRCSCFLDQGLDVEACGLGQNRRRDFDRVIAGKNAQNLWGSQHHGSKPDRKQGA